MMPPRSGHCSVCQAPMLVGVRRCPCCGSGAAGRAADAALRATLQAALGSDFEVRERVARGRRAAIFRVHQRSLDRWVAAKVLTPAADGSDADVARARFVHGVLVLAHLDHPHVIELYGTPETGGLCTMLMPFVDESLAAVLLGRGRFAPLEAAQILKQLAQALDHVHAAGMIHRDVKPQHVLLERPDHHVRLIDFSLATVVGEGSGAAVGRREVVGTPAYMSPEQAQGREDLDAASDLYSLGVVGYQLLTGMVPFEGTAQQQVVAHRVRRPRDPAARYPDIPADLSDVVMRCLAKSPRDRWTSAQELADALAHCLPAQHQS